MPTTEMVAMVAVVAALALGFIHVLRLIGTAMKYKALRKLVESNPASASALLTQLGEADEPRGGDQRLAIILIAIAVAMAAGVMFAVDDPGVIRLGIDAALFPLLIGGALLLNQYLAERRQRASGK
jgi:hypothetical protein